MEDIKIVFGHDLTPEEQDEIRSELSPLLDAMGSMSEEDLVGTLNACQFEEVHEEGLTSEQVEILEYMIMKSLGVLPTMH